MWIKTKTKCLLCDKESNSCYKDICDYCYHKNYSKDNIVHKAKSWYRGICPTCGERGRFRKHFSLNCKTNTLTFKGICCEHYKGLKYISSHWVKSELNNCIPPKPKVLGILPTII